MLANRVLKTRFPRGNWVCKSQVLALKNQRLHSLLLSSFFSNSKITISALASQRLLELKKRRENWRKREKAETNLHQGELAPSHSGEPPLIRHWDENSWVWVFSCSPWVWIAFVGFWFVGFDWDELWRDYWFWVCEFQSVWDGGMFVGFGF